MIIAEVIFWILVAVVVYAYVGYPVLLFLLGKLRPREVRRGPVTPPISLVVVAYNEEEVIAEKMTNTLELDYPPELLEVVVASDGSTDATLDRARAAHPGALILEFPRLGKAKCLNRAVERSTGEILVFSDANAMYDRGALRALARNFADREVGGVCGNMKTKAGRETLAGEGERFYWDYDKRLKELESRIGSIVAADGSIYAIRRSLFRPVEHYVTDDFVLSVRVVEQGGRLVFEPDAVSVEPVLLKSRDSLSRRIRIVEASLQGLLLVRNLLDPRKYGLYALVLISHKLLRRLVAPILLFLLPLNVLLWPGGPLYRLILAGQLVFYLAALLGMSLERWGRSPRILRIPFYFCLGNWGTILGWVMTLRHGRRQHMWMPLRD